MQRIAKKKSRVSRIMQLLDASSLMHMAIDPYRTRLLYRIECWSIEDVDELRRSKHDLAIQLLYRPGALCVFLPLLTG